MSPRVVVLGGGACATPSPNNARANQNHNVANKQAEAPGAPPGFGGARPFLRESVTPSVSKHTYTSMDFGVATCGALQMHVAARASSQPAARRVDIAIDWPGSQEPGRQGARRFGREGWLRYHAQVAQPDLGVLALDPTHLFMQLHVLVRTVVHRVHLLHDLTPPRWDEARGRVKSD